MRVVGVFVEVGLKISRTPWVPLRPRMGRPMAERTMKPWPLVGATRRIAGSFRYDEGFAVLGDPSGESFAHFDPHSP
jgi:hypothetical protein